MRSGDLLNRADVSYSFRTRQVEQLLTNPLFPLVRLSTLETLVQYGCSKRATEEPSGIPMLRMNNLQGDGWDLSDLKYVELSARELDTWRLTAGDILFNRTNSKELVGKCAVFNEPGTWVFASYLIRLRVDPRRVRPEFLAAFLSTEAGRAEIDRESRQIAGMSNINAQEIRTLLVPLPPISTQDTLVAALNAARRSRETKRVQIRQEFASLDASLLNVLGIPSGGPAVESLSFAVSLDEIRTGNKLYPGYFHPTRLSTLHRIERAYPGEASRPLKSIVEFRRDQRKIRDGETFLGLSNVEPHTGERVTSAEDPGVGTVFEFKRGDVLLGRLRPYLNKVLLATENGVCSTEFHVLRPRRNSGGQDIVSAEYLAAVLRSSLVLNQTRYMMTGNTHPRLANEDVGALVVPVPSHKTQEAVAREVQRRRTTARQLNDDIVAEWESAKIDFEARLFDRSASVNGLNDESRLAGV